jgi:hypothetical protein
MMVVLEDEQAQRNGVVVVIYNVDAENNESLFQRAERAQYGMMSRRFSDGPPWRLTAVHYCYNNATIRPFLSISQQVIGREGRLRFLSHFGEFLRVRDERFALLFSSFKHLFTLILPLSAALILPLSAAGSHTECHYVLKTYGIEFLPVDLNGNMSSAAFILWVEEKKKIEAAATTPDWIENPSSADILLGRGKPYQEFPGNQNLLFIVDHYTAAYGKADRDAKGVINMGIVQLIKEKKGRFLQRRNDSGDGWVEVNDIVARDKVSHW